MSRVRILNLPRDCTEDQLRRHLLASLPPSAPHVEITDCVIKRPSAPGRSVIRMAFVGFRNAASGHFVVRHFDQTYFGSAKLRVEVAKGLGEVGVTTNMRKKMEAAEGRARRQAGAEVNNEEAGGKRGRGAGTMKRGRDAMQNTSCLQSHEEEGGGEAAEAELQKTKKKRQKDEFIAERTKATSGPTWASEVLVPETAEPNTEALISGTHMDVNNNNNNNEEEEEAKDEEEAERYALERQQALGEVSDLDFLASLANNTTAASSKQGVTTGKKEEKEKEKEGKGMKGADGEELPQSSEAVSPIKDSQELIVRESRRIRLGNIPYIATEDDVKQFASSLVGSVEAVHIPLTKDTRQSKGAAFVKFIHTADAVRALSLCHGAVFMGRLLRVSAAEDDPYTQKAKGNNDNGGGMAGNSEFKRQKENDRRNENGSTMTWNTMYMNSHAAVESVAKRLGVTPEAVVSVQARGAAVRAAIAEAYLTTEIQQVLSDEGIDFGLLESAQQNILKTRSNTTILVKNIQGMDSDDAAQLSKMFLRYGTLEATAFPSAGGFALFRYTHQQDARVAFQRLSYKLFKNSPLFLEWAPIGAIVTQDDDNDNNNNNNNNNDNNNKGENKAAGDDNDEDDVLGNNAVLAPVFTLFITNIPFTSTEEEFNIFLLDTCTRLSKTPEKYIERLAFEQDKGRAFLTVKDQSTFNYVQQRLNGRSFAKRTLACVPSKQTVTMLNAKTAAAPLSSKGTVGSVPTHMGEKKNEKEDDDEEVAKTSAIVARRGAAAARHGDSRVPSGCDPLKLVVKNVPFEATERDIRDLFSAFSEIRSVRLPRKSHQFSSHRENNHRGFAFVEFLSEGEAGRAMETLRATHLYGRHLVLQYAKLDG